MLTAQELAAYCRVALLGAGAGWNLQELGVQRVRYRDGRESTWGAVISEFARLHAGAGRGPAYVLGRFVAMCFREGLLPLEHPMPLRPYTGGREGGDGQASTG